MTTKSDYIEFVFKSVLVNGEDIPDKEAHIISIIATEFYHNKLPLKNAYLFTQLVLYIERKKCKAVASFCYPPLEVLEAPKHFLWEYTYQPCKNVETIGLILKGKKHLIISQREVLTVQQLKDKIKALMR